MQKNEFELNIEVNKSTNKDFFKEIFGISFLEEKEYFDLVDINSLNYDNKDSLETNKEKSKHEYQRNDIKFKNGESIF